MQGNETTLHLFTEDVLTSKYPNVTWP